MIRYTGHIDGEYFDKKVLDETEAYAIFELTKFINPIRENYAHVKVGISDFKKDRFNQPQNPKKLWILGTQKAKGVLSSGKRFDGTIEYYDRIRPSNRVRDGFEGKEVLEPKRIPLGMTNVFDVQADGHIANWGRMFVTMFDGRVSSPFNRDGLKYKFFNQYKEDDAKINKIQAKLKFQNKIMELSDDQLRYRAIGIGLNGDIDKNILLSKLLTLAEENFEKVKDLFSKTTFVLGYVRDAINKDIIKVSNITNTTKVWEGVPAVTGVSTSRGGDDGVQLMSVVDINLLLKQLSAKSSASKLKEMEDDIDLSVLAGDEADKAPTNDIEKLLGEAFELGVLWHDDEKKTVYYKTSKGNEVLSEKVSFQNRVDSVYQELLNDTKMLKRIRMSVNGKKRSKK